MGMKRNFWALSLLFFVVFLISMALIKIPKVLAIVNLPFGGKVTNNLPITCPDGIEVFNIKPVRVYPVGPYYISATTKRFKYFTATPGRWILGLYSPIPTACVTDSVPPVPIPVFKITIFGSSPSFF